MHPGILDALRADPDDMLHHLVAADWLDDHGDAARAEYVRGWVRLCGMRRSRERTALKWTVGLLHLKHRQDWLGPTPKTVKSGSFAGATLRLEATSDDGIAGLLNRHAVRELSMSAHAASRLAFDPALGLAAGLAIEGRGSHRVSNSSALDRLLTSPYLGRLRSLDLRDNLDNSIAELLEKSRGLAGLRQLRASGGTADEACAVKLLRSRMLAGLEEWHIVGEHITGMSLLGLFDPRRASRWKAITHHGAASMTELRGLSDCTKLERLDLRLPPSLEELGLVLRNKSKLRGLRLGGAVGPAEVRWLAEWPHLARLERLCLSFSAYGFPSTELEPLAASPYRSATTEFAFKQVVTRPDGPTLETLFNGQAS